MSAHRTWHVVIPVLVSLLLLLFGCAIVYVYALMLQITASTDTFETIPCYVISATLISCGVLLMVVAQPGLKYHGRTSRLTTILLTTTVVLSTTATIMTLFLADRHESFSLCIYEQAIRTCHCSTMPRLYNTSSMMHVEFQLREPLETLAETATWVHYRRIASCLQLDLLFDYMLVVTVLFVLGAFCCLAGLLVIYLTWRLELHRRQRQSHHQAHRSTAAALADAFTHAFPHAATSDWDSWLFSSEAIRRYLLGRRPPGYESHGPHPPSCSHVPAANSATPCACQDDLSSTLGPPSQTSGPPGYATDTVSTRGSECARRGDP